MSTVGVTELRRNDELAATVMKNTKAGANCLALFSIQLIRTILRLPRLVQNNKKCLHHYYTVKKKGTFWNLKKRFGRLQKVCKCAESSKKRIKKNSKPLKDLTVCPGEDPFFFETFLSSVDQKKGFVGKYETFRVSY